MLRSQRLIRTTSISNLHWKKATLIYNPVAGRKPKQREREIHAAAAILRAAGVNLSLAATTGPGTAQQLVQSAVSEGCDLILVCGGDGTINEVINGITPGNVTLGILPGGTANMAAKELGLPHSPVRAARQLLSWVPRRIGLGKACWEVPNESGASSSGVRQRYFLSVAGIGFDAHIVYKLCTDFKMSFGVAAYVAEAVRQALRYSFPLIECKVDQRSLQCTFVVINRTSRYGGWLHLAPTASFFQDEFTLCLFTSRHRARYFFYAAAVLARQHLRLPDVQLVEGREVTCAAAEKGQPIRFELDGELVGKLPATFEIVPNALTLLTPQLD